MNIYEHTYIAAPEANKKDIENIEKKIEEILNKIYKKGFEITFPFPFNSIMKFGKLLPYKFYFKITEKKFSKK